MQTKCNCDLPSLKINNIVSRFVKIFGSTENICHVRNLDGLNEENGRQIQTIDWNDVCKRTGR
jgi:hypothetical protein